MVQYIGIWEKGVDLAKYNGGGGGYPYLTSLKPDKMLPVVMIHEENLSLKTACQCMVRQDSIQYQCL